MGIERFFYQSGRLASVSGPQAVYLIHGAGRVLAKSRLGKGYLFAGDASGSVTQEVGPEDRLRIVAYTPYGYGDHYLGVGDDGLFRFNGERNDVLSARYMLGNGERSYSPVLMRFCSPDKLSAFGVGGLNSYAYCKNDPVNYVDPTGCSPGRFAPETYLYDIMPSLTVTAGPQRKVIAASFWDVVTEHHLDATTGMSSSEVDNYFKTEAVVDLVGRTGVEASHMAKMASEKRVLNFMRKNPKQSYEEMNGPINTFLNRGEEAAGMTSHGFQKFSTEHDRQVFVHSVAKGELNWNSHMRLFEIYDYRYRKSANSAADTMLNHIYSARRGGD